MSAGFLLFLAIVVPLLRGEGAQRRLAAGLE
jgi:hypothetical protein